MSIRVMTRVWQHSRFKGSALLLLLAISDFADDVGKAWPSVETLAGKIRMSERQTRSLLRLLEGGGELSTSPTTGPHGVNLYFVHVSEKEEEGGQSLPPEEKARGGNPASVGGQSIAPEPSREPPGVRPPNGAATTRLFEVKSVTTKVRPRGRVDGKVKAQVISALAESLRRHGYPTIDVRAKNIVASQVGDLLRGGWPAESITATAIELGLQHEPTRGYSKLLHLAERQRRKTIDEGDREHERRKLEEAASEPVDPRVLDALRGVVKHIRADRSFPVDEPYVWTRKCAAKGCVRTASLNKNYCLDHEALGVRTG